MARKKSAADSKPEPKRTTVGSSFRLSPRCHQAIEAVSGDYEISKASVIEAGVLLLQATLAKTTRAQALARIESARNPK